MPTGQTDNSFAEGSKENETNVSVGLGSVPNKKADLGRMYTSYEQFGNDVMLYLGWARNSTSGTTNFDFEVNRVTQPNLDTAGAKTLIRTAGDLLISYDFQGGAQKPTLAIREWDGSQWGAANPLDATEAESEVNRTAIVDSLGTTPVDRAAFTFGEASINLTKAGVFVPGVCESFGSIFVKSRSADQITATLKDFISPEPVNISNCASGIIRKETDPNGAAGSFGFTQNLDASWSVQPQRRWQQVVRRRSLRDVRRHREQPAHRLDAAEHRLLGLHGRCGDNRWQHRDDPARQPVGQVRLHLHQPGPWPDHRPEDDRPDTGPGCDRVQLHPLVGRSVHAR